MSALLYQMRADAPVGLWPLDETSGTTAYDRSGSGKNGTYNGVTLAQPGLFVAPRFTASGSNNVIIPDDVLFQLTVSFSVEAWFRLATATTYAGIVSKGGDSYYVRHNGGGAKDVAMFRSQQGPPTIDSTTVVNDSVWHHVVGVKPSGTTAPAIWLDAVSVGENPATGSFTAANGKALRIGSDFTNVSTQTEFFDGWIAYVAIYNSELSAARIAAHYQAGIRSGVVLG